MENELEMENSPNPEESDSETNTDNGEQEISQKPESPPKAPPVRQDIYERMKRAEDEVKRLKEQPARKVPSGDNTQNPMEVVRLAKALEGHSEEEVDFIARNATEKSIDGIIAASKDEWVKTAIDARREKVAQENKIPGSTSPDSSSFEKKITKDTPPEEVDKILQARLDKVQRESKSV
jgi:hypothetical protein